MQVTINGDAVELDHDVTVAALVASRVDAHRHVAVAVNGAVVPRGVWETTRLKPGDAVEVVAPVAGG
jgi:sulfur carrier protein